MASTFSLLPPGQCHHQSISPPAIRQQTLGGTALVISPVLLGLIWWPPLVSGPNLMPQSNAFYHHSSSTSTVLLDKMCLCCKSFANFRPPVHTAGLGPAHNVVLMHLAPRKIIPRKNLTIWCLFIMQCVGAVNIHSLLLFLIFWTADAINCWW